MVDQVLSSGTGLLLVVLVARADDATTFGALSIGLIVNGFLLGIVRAVIGEIIVLRCRTHPSTADDQARLGFTLMLVAGAAASIGLAIAGVVVGAEIGSFLGIVALAVPFIYAQDLIRYMAYGTGRLGRAVVLDSMWLVVQAGISIALLVTNTDSPTRFALAWTAGAAVSAIVGSLAYRMRPQRGATAVWWRQERQRAGGFVSDFLVSTGMVQISFIALGALLPLDDFGALRVAFVSLSPLANLIAGVRTLTLAHLAGLEQQPLRARRNAGSVGLALAAAGAAYGLTLVLIPDAWGVQLFGSTWTQAEGLVTFVALGEVCRLSAFPAIDLVKVFAPPFALVRSRLFATVGVVVGLLGGAALAGPSGSAKCVAAAYAVAAAIWWRQAILRTSDTSGATGTREADRPAAAVSST